MSPITRMLSHRSPDISERRARSATRPTARRRTREKHVGLLAAAALAGSCVVTTVLLAAGVATSAGLAGSLELTVIAIAVPATVLTYKAVRRTRGAPTATSPTRCPSDDLPREDRP